MNTKPCMSSHNKRIIILIYTKDCSGTEGYKKQTNSVAQKMAASEVLSTQNVFEPWLIFIYVINSVSDLCPTYVRPTSYLRPTHAGLDPKMHYKKSRNSDNTNSLFEQCIVTVITNNTLFK